MKIKRNLPSSDIPTASMADIAFLLIIFFMVTSVFSATKGLDFTLPKEEKDDRERHQGGSSHDDMGYRLRLVEDGVDLDRHGE